MAGFINKAQLGVYAYLSSASNTTTPSTANEFTAINGTFINDPLQNFSLGVDSLLYNGESGIYFEIDWHASFELTSANVTVNFGVSINSETLTTSGDGVVGTFAKNNSQSYAVSGTRVVKLNKGDTIQLQLASSGSSSTVTVNHFTTTIKRFFIN